MCCLCGALVTPAHNRVCVEQIHYSNPLDGSAHRASSRDPVLKRNLATDAHHYSASSLLSPVHSEHDIYDPRY